MRNFRVEILDLMAVIFEMEVADIPENAAPGVIEKWDSLKHMTLIVALEEEFGIRFTDDEMADLLNLDLIDKIIVSKLQGQHA